MKVLLTKIADFRELMIAKLEKVAWKHGGLESVTSCTADRFDWSNIAIAAEVRDHLLQEIGEYLVSRSDSELIDIANCSMILYEMKKAGA